MRKRILRDEEAIFDCDVMFVVKVPPKDHFSGITSPARRTFQIYNNCSIFWTHDNNTSQKMNDYECLFYAMLENSNNCKGYLFLRNKSDLHYIQTLLENDRKQIWYGTKSNAKRLEVSFRNTHFFHCK